MRVRIIASKPRRNDEEDLSGLIGQEFEVLSIYPDGVEVENDAPVGYFLYRDEYEVVEQKETPSA